MPTKTDRILSYLPRTFRALPRPTALYSLVDAFGTELLEAENSLAEVMASHWVDHADRAAELIGDLACIAALCGLAPRGAAPALPGAQPSCPPVASDETVEEFREHLKRYVRIFLDGTATVRGILRIVAEALGLRIADEYAEMDPWWRRSHDALIIEGPASDDAAELLFGVRAATVAGLPAQAAQVTGTVDLQGGADLRAGSLLHLSIDGGPALDVDLAAGAPDPTAVPLDHITATINAVAGGPAGSHDGHFLTLSSPTVGPGSALEALATPGDAAPHVLGLSPRTYRGADAAPARLVGRVDLSGGTDLRDERYIRLLVDAARLAEVDCAASAADPARVTLGEVVAAINSGLGIDIASHDGQVVILTSPTTGFGSRIVLLSPAAQAATQRLFGAVETFHAGRDAMPAEVLGTRDLSTGVDLRPGSLLRISVDGAAPVTVDCTGEDPARTRPTEIVAALSGGLGPGLASHDGRFVRLRSRSVGAVGVLAFEPVQGDAAESIFGITPTRFLGSAATAAHVVGRRDLSSGVDLRARSRVRVAVDAAAPVDVNVRSAADASRVTLDEIAAGLNAAVGAPVASHDGRYLAITSPTIGEGSRVAIGPLILTRRRRFVTRAFVANEAADSVFGFHAREVVGETATGARVAGTVDLSRGVDLRSRRFLRVAVDERPAREIDFGRLPRPRTATLDEVREAIAGELGQDVVSHDGHRLNLTSRTTEEQSRIAFEPPVAPDALDVLLAIDPGVFRGRDPSRVTFTGTSDLSGGVDLSAAGRVMLAVEGAAPVEIDCAGADPARTTLNEIVMKINIGLGVVAAHHDGSHVILASPSTGAASMLEFAQPAAGDATPAIFGITAPRRYRGADAAEAQVVGRRDLSGGVDLRVARFLRIAEGIRPAIDVDCAGGAADPAHVTLDEIVTAIQRALGPGVAAHDGSHLILTSVAAGAAAQIGILRHTSGDARAVLFGNVPDVTTGRGATPAMLTGEVDLLAPVNLRERPLLKLAVDGRSPVEVSVAGAVPEATFLDEIVSAINGAVPGLASPTDDARLRLTSPSIGPSSRLAVLPLRTVELIEYPPEQQQEGPHHVHHGERFVVQNGGAADTVVEVTVTTPQGAVGPGFVNHAVGERLRLRMVMVPGDRARLWSTADGRVRATITAADGMSRLVPDDRVVGDSRTLALPRGRSEWTYLECYGPRFDYVRFNAARFADGRCDERAVFNVSRFSQMPPGDEAAVFAAAGPLVEPRADVQLSWKRHRVGAFVVNLPADLPDRFGGRFNDARFGSAADTTETYLGVFTEPPGDPDTLAERLTVESKLVSAAVVPRLPIGWRAETIPFRGARRLIGGAAVGQARVYLAERGVPGFIEVRAREPGAWANAIELTVLRAGPGRFDVTVGVRGGRFENARLIATGPSLAATATDLLRPGPVGVLQAKAAGVRAAVTRDGAYPDWTDT